MRLFISVQPPREIQEYLISLQKSFSSQCKIVFTKEVHLTLKFLGEVSPALARMVEDKLLQVKFSRFTLHLSGMGVFPGESSSRVLWVGIAPEKEINALQQQIDILLKESFPQEKGFTPHLTLGRIKFLKNKSAFVDTLKKMTVKALSFEVSSFALKQSTLGKDGPAYSTIKEYTARAGKSL